MKTLTGRQLQEFTNELDRIAVTIGILRQNGKLGNQAAITVAEKDELLLG